MTPGSRGVGPSFGQSRRHPRRGRLSFALRQTRRGARCADRMIKAHEIQGVLALENSFNRVGLDHVLLVRVASTAVVTAMLGARASRSSMPYRMRGSMAAHLEPTGTRRTLVHARVGPRAMRPAEPCAMRCLRSKARWVIPRRCPPKRGASKTCCSRENPLYCRSRWPAT